MTIVKWLVTPYAKAPERKEYDRETEHFYVRANKQRDSKISRYYRYFDTEAEALEFITDRNAERTRSKEIDQIKRHAVELLEALEAVTGDLFYQVEAKHGPEAASKYPSVVVARAAIAKAKGTAQ